MNAFDVVILFSFLAIICVGFFNGITRLTSAIFAIYFAALCAGLFYRPLARETREHLVTMGQNAAQLTTFMLLFLVFFVAYTLIISHWLSDLNLPRRVAVMDNIGGAALGVVVSALAMTLAAILITVLVQALDQTVGSANQGTIFGFLERQTDGSALVPVFLRLAPFFLGLLSPWFPSGLPPILDGAAGL